MEIQQALQAARDRANSVLTTIKRDGKPQLSNVLHAVGDDGVIRISTTADRAKCANLRRNPWAACTSTGRLLVLRRAEGDVALRPRLPTTRRSRSWWASIARSRASTRTGTTTAPRWSRSVACVRIRPTHAYGALR